MQKLKKEINIRYNIMRYKKLWRNFLYNRMEKNNVEFIYEAIIDIKKYFKNKADRKNSEI